MMTIMPSWYTEAAEKLNECIDEIVRKNYIDWAFSHDSQTIENAKEAILGALVTIDEQVKNPFNISKEKAEEMGIAIENKAWGKRKYKMSLKSRKNISRGMAKSWAARKKLEQDNGKQIRPRYPKEMKDFLKANVNKTSNQGLVELVFDRFGIKTTKPRIAVYMSMNNIRRRK